MKHIGRIEMLIGSATLILAGCGGDGAGAPGGIDGSGGTGGGEPPPSVVVRDDIFDGSGGAGGDSGGTGNRYVIVSFPGQSLEASRADMESRFPGFHLATITSQAEQDFIDQLIAADGSSIDGTGGIGGSAGEDGAGGVGGSAGEEGAGGVSGGGKGGSGGVGGSAGAGGDDGSEVREVPPQLWLGGAQDPIDEPDPAASWSWVTGEPWGYTNWAPNEPNDRPENVPAFEQHLVYNILRGWNDEPESTDRINGYIAESDGPAAP